jgi:FtsP/CotA-like multicopper oxidase with cupredoxin domain
MDRRDFIALGVGAAFFSQLRKARAEGAPPPIAAPGGQVACIMPNIATLPWKMSGNVKVGHLVAHALDHEFAPGLRAEVWGYNGSTPGPLIEAVEGDRVRIYVTNRLREPTTVHWHGVIVPNGMDGVAGLTQKPIPAGETYVYEFTFRHPGTFLYHSHADEMIQIALGLVGMIVVHPKVPRGPRVARDFALLSHEWRVDAGAKRPNPLEMLDFNVLTFNGKSFPGTDPLMVEKGERIRIRLGNLSPMSHHPIHLHGTNFKVTATDGGFVPESAQQPETTVLVPVGSTRTIELTYDEPGDWAMHCHMTHHIMTQMGHGAANMVGATTSAVDARLQRVDPRAMTMGQTGMSSMGEMNMPVPQNSIPMKSAAGPFSPIDMGGMFTIIKVRDRLQGADPKGFYAHPKGTVSEKADAAEMQRDGIDPNRTK